MSDIFRKIIGRKGKKEDIPWKCHKCGFINESSLQKCRGPNKCGVKYNKDKDQPYLEKENEIPPSLSPPKKSEKPSADVLGSEGIQSIIARRTPEGDLVCENGKTTEQWQCKICSEFNQVDQSLCKVCKSKKEEFMRKRRDRKSGNFLNRKRQKIGNRTQLKAGNSVRASKQRDEDKQKALWLWQNMVEYFQESGGHYVDRSFPDASDENTEWIRIDEINDLGPSGQWTVFKDPSPDDAVQGGSENCWFLCSLSLLAQRKDLLQDIFITSEYCPQGIYVVRICKDGNWKSVFLDDRFPCDPKTRTLQYASSNNNQLWVMLLEKAAAKIHGGYSALNEGLIVESLAMLTGEPCQHIDFRGSDMQKKDDKMQKVDKEDTWNDMKIWKKKDYLLGVSTSKQTNHADLKESHAYPVIDIREQDQQRLIRLWTSAKHKHHITGCLKDSPLSQNKQDLPYKKGEFWVTFDELLENFNYLSVCKANKEWFESRRKGAFPTVLNREWKYFTFRLIQDETKLHLGLFQKSMRSLGPNVDELFTDLSIMVLKNRVDHTGFPFKQAPLFTRVMEWSARRARSLTTCEATLPPGSYTVACLSFRKLITDDRDINEEDFVEYTLAIHSSVMLQFMDECEVDFTKFRELKFAPADAIITLARQLTLEKDWEGIQHYARISQIMENVYSVMLMWYGEICIIINKSKDIFFYVRDYSRSTCLTSSRGDPNTKDLIKPNRAQVINVLTPQHPVSDWFIAAKKLFQRVDEGFKMEPTPEITDELKGLFIDRPIPDIEYCSKWSYTILVS